MKKTRWEQGEDQCPKCKRLTELKMSGGKDGHEYILKERCQSCGWVIDFSKLEE